MSSQTLAQAFANVHDFGAYGDGIHDDSLAIQGAIDNADGKQVLFPEGVYLLAGDARDGGRTTNRASIEFGNDGQRATFLAGARLQLASAADFVRVSGTDQAFVGMRIHRGDHGDALGVPPITIGHDPMLDVDGADRVAFRDLRVSSNVPAPTLVRLRALTGCRFTGGRLLGDAGEGVGLRLGEAGDEGSVIRVSAIGLTIDQVGVGVRFDSTAEAVSFTGCRFGEITKTGIVLGPEEAQKLPVQIRSLTVSGCRFVQGEPKRWVRVRSSADARGVTVSGCWFGHPSQDADDPGRVFVIEGRLAGAVVTGCFLKDESGGKDSGSSGAIWEIAASATVAGACDMFNAWPDVEVATGANADKLCRMTSDTSGKLRIVASSLRFDSTRATAETRQLGFFGLTTAPQPDPFTNVVPLSQALVPGSEREVLNRLIWDLARLGVVRSG